MKNKKKILIALILLGITIGIIGINFKTDINLIKGEDNKFLQEYAEIGQGGKIISADIIDRKTGTGPFDENDEAGNDSSESNEIVRSFDNVSWKFNLTMGLKNTNSTETYKGGQINVKATLPNECKNMVQWDLDLMAWGENIQLSDDGTVFTASYNMSDNEVTIPGNQAIEVVAKVLGAKNGMTIEPEFQFWLTGNEDADKVVKQDNYQSKKVKVSSAPSYNIVLYQNSSLQRKTTLDYGEGDKEGRIYGYATALQLYNTNEAKGLKGIEYPEGDINFDINLQLTRVKENSNEKEDITSLCTPVLWNYKINNSNEGGNIPNRTMKFGPTLSQYYRDIPYGVRKEDRARSVYNSGNITMTQTGNKINTEISEYGFDGVFPHYKAVVKDGENPLYGDNVGCFNISYFQIFIPDNEESAIVGRDYEVTVSVDNFRAETNSGTVVENQVKTDDDTITNTHYVEFPTTYKQSCMLVNDDATAYLGTSFNTGDGKAVIGEYIQYLSKFAISVASNYDIQSAIKFMKFDGEAVEPALYSDGDKYKINSFGGNPVFNVWYITKPDGTNWTSQEEMNNGKIEDMLYFENIEDIPEGYICIGEYLELVDGKIPVETGENNTVVIRLKVKDTAKAGKVYGFTPFTVLWKGKIDNNLYSITKQNFSEWPRASWSSGYKNYIKTEYDETGEIKPGTHSIGWDWGQSMLVLGSDLKLSKQAIDDDENEKTKYNLAKNEFNVTYKLTPSLPQRENSNLVIDNVNLKIEDTLPKGITYIPGSTNYDEPTITTKSDGSTLLTWYIYGKTVGEDIEPIIYKASIDNETENNTVYETKAVVSEIIGNDGAVKIGNSAIANRTAKSSITIVNLASYALYKTTTTPVIEKNGEIHYRFTAINKTDSDLEDFQLLDILPYNGDGRGTSYNGNYKLNKIELKGINISTQQLTDISDVTLKITDSVEARTTANVEQDNLGETWEEITSSQTINAQTTAFAVVGTLKARNKLIVDIILHPNGNEAKDIFVNSAKERTYRSETAPIETSNVEVKTVNREISGMVWFDSNKNGIKDNQEEFIKNVGITLLNSSNQEIDRAETNENGYYIFENIPKGKYRVKVNINDDEKEITIKEAGANALLNSIFNANYTTDLIESLDTLESPVIFVKNVNAGIAYKDAKVVVHYYKKNTTEQVSRDKEIKGKLHDTYETQEAENVDSKYYLYEVTSNKTGTMLNALTEVIYYYDLKDAHVVGKYLEKDNETNVLAGEYKKDGKVDDNYSVPKLDIKNYTYVEDTSNTSGKMELNENNNTITVIYYYKKRDDLHYTVNHKDKDTGEILDTKTVSNKTYLDTVTSASEVETIEGYNFDSVEKEQITIVSDEEQNVINIYYKKRNDLSYTIHYKEQGTENPIIGDKVVPNMTYKSNVLVRADSIEGYNAVDPVMKEIEITTGRNEVTFYYTRREELSYTIQYKDKDTNELIKADKVVKNQTFGETVQVQAEPIKGYIMQEPTTAEITITVEPQNYIFYYVKRNNLKYVVHYLEKDTERKLKEDKLVTNKTYLETVEETAENIYGYEVDGAKVKEIRLNKTEEDSEKNEITFYYTRTNDLGYIIHYVEKDTNKKLKEDKIVSNQTYLDRVEVRADEIPGYIVDKNVKEVEITNEEINTVTFYYTKRKDLSYTVYYMEKETKEKLSENKTVENREFGEKVTETAKEIEGYLIEGEKTKELEITANEEQNKIIFYYISKDKDTLSNNSDTTENESSNNDIEKEKFTSSKNKANVKTGDKIIVTVITLFVSTILLIITKTPKHKKKHSKK